MKDIDIKRRRNFISSLSEFGRDPSSSTAGGFGYFLIKKMGRDDRGKDWKNVNSLFKRRFPCHPVVGSQSPL